jgi:hypothetical protein
MSSHPVGLPGRYDASCEDASPADFVLNGLSPGQLIEGDLGTDGCILLGAGQKSRATKLGYWVDGVVLGASKRSWLAWFAGHNPAEEGSGLFHFCLSVRCAASTKREHLAIVHVARFRALSTGQAKTLAYARDGLVAYEAALNGEGHCRDVG